MNRAGPGILHSAIRGISADGGHAVPANQSENEQMTPPASLSGLQGEGGSGRRQGEPNHRPAGRAFRGPSNQITTWKSQLEESASQIFRPGGGTPATPAVEVKSLHAKIGELTLENDS